MRLASGIFLTQVINLTDSFYPTFRVEAFFEQTSNAQYTRIMFAIEQFLNQPARRTIPQLDQIRRHVFPRVSRNEACYLDG